MSDLFDSLSTFFELNDTSTNLLLGLLGLFLFTLGLLVGWYLQRKETARARAQLLSIQSDHKILLATRTRLEQGQKEAASDLQQLATSNNENLNSIASLKAEHLQRDAEIVNLNAKLEKLETANQTYAITTERLNAQVISLKDQTEQLEKARVDQIDEEAFDPATAQASFIAAEPRPPKKPAIDQPALATGFNLEDYGEEETAGDEIATVDSRLEEIEARLAENSERRNTPKQCAEEPGVNNFSQPNTAAATSQVKAAEGKNEERDDLTHINKIGTFLQKQLNEVGIYRFTQIANWTAEDIDKYTELIGYLPGVIAEDDWVGQARQLIGETVKAPVAQEKPAEVPDFSGDTNLRRIEGIGPRINALLNENGIMTMGDLAQSNTETLQRLLNEAGGSFRFHDPKTWVAQAGLAADGKLDQLERWQKELRGGL